MSDLSGLELRRRALERTGWTDIGHCRHPTLLSGIFPKGARHGGMCDAINGRLAHLPAVESDAGISEPWFLEWCEKNGWLFTLTLDVNGLRLELFRRSRHIASFEVSGATPSEARARAVVAATEEKEG